MAVFRFEKQLVVIGSDGVGVASDYRSTRRVEYWAKPMVVVSAFHIRYRLFTVPPYHAFQAGRSTSMTD